MDEAERTGIPPWAVRAVLVGFVLAWMFGPYELRSAVPIWVAFAIALGLELQFLYSAVRAGPRLRPDRRPQAGDRERFGYEEETDELLIVRDGDEELWIPYAGETPEEIEELIAEARDWPEEEPEEAPILERSRWPAVRRFLTGLSVLGVLALVIWFVETRTGWDSVSGEKRLAAVERYSDEASRIAGKPVTIRCDESRDYVGFVQHADGVALVGGDRAYVTPEICHDLYRLAFEAQEPSSRTARAIAVLAHEAWHLRGVRDEGTTECFALQSGVGLGQRLGLSEDTARRLMRQQLVENARRGGTTFEYRVPPECRDGSELDLNRDAESFP